MKDAVLPRHIRDMGGVNGEQVLRERQIADNLDLVRARSQDLEQSSSMFMSGEHAYQRLLMAKSMDLLAH